jgi:hypothetical protein
LSCYQAPCAGQTDTGHDEARLCRVDRITLSSGQDLAEYGIALAVVGLGVTTAAAAIAGNVEVLWENASSVIATAITKGKDTCCD